MKTLRYTNILFDFDGTIADTNKGIVLTVQETLRQMSLPIPDSSEISKIIGLPLDDCFRIAAKVDGSRVKEASNLYRSIFMDIALEKITLFEGVLETLQKLKDEGVFMAIASSRNLVSLLPLAKYFGIDKFIDYIYGEDDCLNPKPAPDLALKIMKEHNLRSHDTLVVGDTIYDLMMGLSAGCEVCGVTFGNHSKEKLLTANPTHIVDRFPEILSIL